MTTNQIPQLRIAVTFPCGKACVYCRPGGESVPIPPEREMTCQEIISLTRILVNNGIKDIKLTGGDPMLRQDIVDIVRGIKSIPNVNSVHLVTRHAKTANYIDGLANAGLDLLNFSLDSINADTWSQITRTNGHEDLINAIELAAQSSLTLKINTVVIKGINDHEINQLIDYAGKLKCEIKFLDLIVDIPDFPKVSEGFGNSRYFDLEQLLPALKQTSLNHDIYFQPGGLGHPMSRFHMPNGATVVVKSSKTGAWYGSVCQGCSHFPCHDALMALRLTPDGKLQFCLLRDDNLVDLLQMLASGCAEEEISAVVQETISVYRNAKFFSYEAITKERAEHAGKLISVSEIN